MDHGQGMTRRIRAGELWSRTTSGSSLLVLDVRDETCDVWVCTLGDGCEIFTGMNPSSAAIWERYGWSRVQEGP